MLTIASVQSLERNGKDFFEMKGSKQVVNKLDSIWKSSPRQLPIIAVLAYSRLYIDAIGLDKPL
jgi:hypothetical protein